MREQSWKVKWMKTSSIRLTREKFSVRKANFMQELSIIFLVILDLIRNINDPEHPLTLEELHVLEQSRITVNSERGEVFVQFTPTIPVSLMNVFKGEWRWFRRVLKEERSWQALSYANDTWIQYFSLNFPLQLVFFYQYKHISVTHFIIHPILTVSLRYLPPYSTAQWRPSSA